MMCAASLLEYSCSHLHCTLYEKNENLWAKVIISGWGRCNVTTAYYRKCDIQTKYIGGWDLISCAISQFWPRQIVRRFQDHWVWMKTESDQRIFPISNDGHDIVDCFTNIFQQYSCIDVLTKTIVVQVNCLSQGGFQLKLADWSIDKVDILVITTWWNAYRHTWSTWDGYTFVQSCGHHVTQLWPSLSSFHTLEIPLHRCSWVSFEYASLSWSREWWISRWERYECEGPVLLTHFGISGPAVFIMSAHLAFRQIDATHPVIIRLKPFANYDISWWHQNFSFAVISHPRQHIINYLSHYMPHRFVHTLLNSLSIDDNIYLSQLTKEQKKILIQSLMSLLLNNKFKWAEKEEK